MDSMTFLSRISKVYMEFLLLELAIKSTQHFFPTMESSDNTTESVGLYGPSSWASHTNVWICCRHILLWSLLQAGRFSNHLNIWARTRVKRPTGHCTSVLVVTGVRRNNGTFTLEEMSWDALDQDQTGPQNVTNVAPASSQTPSHSPE